MLHVITCTWPILLSTWLILYDQIQIVEMSISSLATHNKILIVEDIPLKYFGPFLDPYLKGKPLLFDIRWKLKFNDFCFLLILFYEIFKTRAKLAAKATTVLPVFRLNRNRGLEELDGLVNNWMDNDVALKSIICFFSFFYI